MDFKNIEDYVMPHKKKAVKKTPKKSNHKHSFEPCVIEYDAPYYTRERGRVHKKDEKLAYYCTICGRLNSSLIFDNSHFYDYGLIKTEEYYREINHATRTLPTFEVDCFWESKFVKLPEANK